MDRCRIATDESFFKAMVRKSRSPNRRFCIAKKCGTSVNFCNENKERRSSKCEPAVGSFNA
jgi:hypothetical protein